MRILNTVVDFFLQGNEKFHVGNQKLILFCKCKHESVKRFGEIIQGKKQYSRGAFDWPYTYIFIHRL